MLCKDNTRLSYENAIVTEIRGAETEFCPSPVRALGKPELGAYPLSDAREAESSLSQVDFGDLRCVYVGCVEIT